MCLISAWVLMVVTHLTRRNIFSAIPYVLFFISGSITYKAALQWNYSNIALFLEKSHPHWLCHL